jgi:hypothetical protein
MHGSEKFIPSNENGECTIANRKMKPLQILSLVGSEWRAFPLTDNDASAEHNTRAKQSMERNDCTSVTTERSHNNNNNNQQQSSFVTTLCAVPGRVLEFLTSSTKRKRHDEVTSDLASSLSPVKKHKSHFHNVAEAEWTAMREEREQAEIMILERDMHVQLQRQEEEDERHVELERMALERDAQQQKELERLELERLEELNEFERIECERLKLEEMEGLLENEHLELERWAKQVSWSDLAIRNEHSNSSFFGVHWS